MKFSVVLTTLAAVAGTAVAAPSMEKPAVNLQERDPSTCTDPFWVKLLGLLMPMIFTEMPVNSRLVEAHRELAVVVWSSLLEFQLGRLQAGLNYLGPYYQFPNFTTNRSLRVKHMDTTCESFMLKNTNSAYNNQTLENPRAGIAFSMRTGYMHLQAPGEVKTIVIE